MAVVRGSQRVLCVRSGHSAELGRFFEADVRRLKLDDGDGWRAKILLWSIGDVAATAAGLPAIGRALRDM